MLYKKEFAVRTFGKFIEAISPKFNREMVEGIIGADCAGGSHREINGWSCELCDYSEKE